MLFVQGGIGLQTAFTVIGLAVFDIGFELAIIRSIRSENEYTTLTKLVSAFDIRRSDVHLRATPWDCPGDLDE